MVIKVLYYNIPYRLIKIQITITKTYKNYKTRKEGIDVYRVYIMLGNRVFYSWYG